MIRPAGNPSIVEQQIENEIRAIAKLCEGSSHQNIIHIVDHGWILKEYYFIDMELLGFSLGDLIFRDFKTPVGPNFYSVLGNSEDLMKYSAQSYSELLQFERGAIHALNT